MQAVQTLSYGISAKLGVKDANRPKIKPGEVLVEVHASSVNPKDWKLNVPIFSLTPNFLPMAKKQTFGDDLSGVVVEKGSAVSGLEVGDEVFGMSMNFRTGSCAEFAAIAANCVAIKPKNMTHIEAGAVPLAALTALQMLQRTEVKEGSKVLVIGASGGVGTYAVQLACAMGAKVTGVCSGKNEALVRSLGAEDVFDYTARDFKNEDHDFDAVLDATSYESLFSCSSLLKKGGHYINTLGYGPSMIMVILAKLFKFGQKAHGLFVKANTDDLNILRAYIESGQVKSIIDTEFPISDLEKAYEKSKSGRSVGKLVIKVK